MLLCDLRRAHHHQPLLITPCIPVNPDPDMPLHPNPLSAVHHSAKSAFFLFCSLCLLMASGLTGCNSPQKKVPQDLYSQLELTGKINTFPLCVVISESLPGKEFPADLKELCGFSKSGCKTLPDAGILRSGADVYYKYNCFEDLKIPEADQQDEAGITQAVEKQSNTFYSNTTLKNYDSLLMPNEAEWNVRDFPAIYIGNTSDSVFFYSNQAGAPSAIEVKGRSFPVYTNVKELRSRIDALICRGYLKVAVFYNPLPSGPEPATTSSSDYTLKGTRAGDSCVETSRYEKLHDGSGGFLLGKLLKANSTACGFENEPSLASAPVTPPVSRPVQAPPRQTAPATDRLEPAIGEEFDNPAPAPKKDMQCARKGEPVCEQDDNKNFTGRRVQYCYNKQGQIVRTIVVSKCEADCRCF